MPNSSVIPPANFRDWHPQRGPWRALETPPPNFATVETLLPDGTTSYHATWLGGELWSSAKAVKPLAWRPMDVVAAERRGRK